MRKFLLYLYITLVEVSITCFSVQNTFAEERRTITILNSSYFENFYTNKQMANFGMEFLENSSFVLRELKTVVKDEINNKILRNTLSFTINLFDFRFIFVFLVSYHEFGHTMRFNAAGMDNNAFIKYNSVKKGMESTSNFFVYLVDGIFSNILENLNSAATTTYLFEKLSSKENLIMSAGGLNNQMYFQEKAFDDIMYRNNKISNSYLTYSILNSIFIYYYGNIASVEKGGRGDIGSVLKDFEDLGINVTKENFKSSIITSLLFSQFTYSSLYSLFSGKDSIKPLQYKGFIFPDVFPYITTRGISYRIKSAYRYSDDLIFRFGIEFVAYGEFTKELIFGINTKLMGNTRLDLLTVFGKNSTNMEITYTIPIAKHFNINLDFDLHSTKSLYGERNAYRLYELGDPYIDKFIKKTDEGREEKINEVIFKQYRIKKPISYSYYFGLSLSYIF